MERLRLLRLVANSPTVHKYCISGFSWWVQLATEADFQRTRGYEVQSSGIQSPLWALLCQRILAPQKHNYITFDTKQSLG